MVEDHVLSVSYAGSILVIGSYGSHTEAHVAYNDIVGTGERSSVTIYGDTLTGSCLTSYVKVAAEYKTRVDAYYTSHVEHDDTVRLAYGIA